MALSTTTSARWTICLPAILVTGDQCVPWKDAAARMQGHYETEMLVDGYPRHLKV